MIHWTTAPRVVDGWLGRIATPAAGPEPNLGAKRHAASTRPPSRSRLLGWHTACSLLSRETDVKMAAATSIDLRPTRTELHPPLFIGQPRLVKRPRVLLAEDDVALRSLLAATLRKDGYEVLEARDGAEVLGQLEGVLDSDRGWTASSPPPKAPDLIISDIRMPGLTGFEVLDAIRSARLRTPVILITAFGAPETHARAKALGAAAVMDKPFELDDLRRLIQRLVDRDADGGQGGRQ